MSAPLKLRKTSYFFGEDSGFGSGSVQLRLFLKAIFHKKNKNNIKEKTAQEDTVAISVEEEDDDDVAEEDEKDSIAIQGCVAEIDDTF